jgi:hypothetical protein
VAVKLKFCDLRSVQVISFVTSPSEQNFKQKAIFNGLFGTCIKCICDLAKNLLLHPEVKVIRMYYARDAIDDLDADGGRRRRQMISRRNAAHHAVRAPECGGRYHKSGVLRRRLKAPP